MTKVIGVRFKNAGKLYFFDPGAFWPSAGEYVIVETARGMELGEVITGVREIEDEQVVAPLKSVIRVATEQDIQHAKDNEANEKEAFRICQEKIEEHKLDMKLVRAEYTFDNSKIQFYFTSNGRVDFRLLVKDLASIFKTRIDLRQIGVRDEAKLLGGLGPCGRAICCGAFLGDFQPVSIKMAKEQNLSLNPTKISGVCGRLMCCLKYEQDTYEATRKRMPKTGKEVITPDGNGVVWDINVVKETVRVRVQKGDTTELKDYPLEEVQRVTPPANEKDNARMPKKPAEETAKPEQTDEAVTAQPIQARPAQRPPRPRAEKPNGSKAPQEPAKPAEPEQQAQAKPAKAGQAAAQSVVSPWQQAVQQALKAAQTSNEKE